MLKTDSKGLKSAGAAASLEMMITVPVLVFYIPAPVVVSVSSGKDNMSELLESL
jgi:hypothetical protein